jgi:hypothetical protein
MPTTYPTHPIFRLIILKFEEKCAKDETRNWYLLQLLALSRPQLQNYSHFSGPKHITQNFPLTVNIMFYVHIKSEIISNLGF